MSRHYQFTEKEMREIKFRCWSKEVEKMYYSVTIDENGKVEHAFELDNEGRVKSKPGTKTEEDCIPMQFTGLKDENGEEIYEGDLFGKMGGNVEKPDEYEVHAIVYFDTDLAAFCIDDNRGGWQYLHDYLSEPRNRREVIGNIWENPELME